LAKRGSTKWFSERQEEKVARVYGGDRSPSSGAAVTDAGDVRMRHLGNLCECKHRGTFDKPAKSITLKLEDLEKIADEAWAEGLEPMMVLSIYAPDSVLADKDGEVHCAVRLMLDDWKGRTHANGQMNFGLA
jgi:hypothetical protein